MEIALIIFGCVILAVAAICLYIENRELKAHIKEKNEYVKALKLSNVNQQSLITFYKNEMNVRRHDENG